jgi:hypothetical protein
VDLDLFSEIHRVERALKNHSCAEALAWCSENKASLRKLKVRCRDIYPNDNEYIYRAHWNSSYDFRSILSLREQGSESKPVLMLANILLLGRRHKNI